MYLSRVIRLGRQGPAATARPGAHRHPPGAGAERHPGDVPAPPPPRARSGAGYRGDAEPPRLPPAALDAGDRARRLCRPAARTAVTDGSHLAAMTRAELLELATERGVVGRWRMSKAELLAALASADGDQPRPRSGCDDPGDILVRRIPDETRDRGRDRGRRARLAERLAAVVDTDRRCDWAAVDGTACGLPPVVDQARCALHGGIDVFDRAVAVTGRLGLDTWPTLARHLAQGHLRRRPHRARPGGRRDGLARRQLPLLRLLPGRGRGRRASPGERGGAGRRQPRRRVPSRTTPPSSPRRSPTSPRSPAGCG